MTRQQRRHEAWVKAWSYIRNRYRNQTMRGFNWAGELTRKGARLAARKMAKAA